MTWTATSRREEACVSTTCPTWRTWWGARSAGTASWRTEKSATVENPMWAHLFLDSCLNYPNPVTPTTSYQMISGDAWFWNNRSGVFAYQLHTVVFQILKCVFHTVKQCLISIHFQMVRWRLEICSDTAQCDITDNKNTPFLFCWCLLISSQFQVFVYWFSHFTEVLYFVFPFYDA